jgi:S-formylglutathione hydrolase FrmB
MKKYTLIILVLLCGHSPELKAQQYLTRVDTAIYCPSLDTTQDISMYLPPGYYEYPFYHYPVVYLLHGWKGNDNNIVGVKDIYANYMNEGEDKCVIIVAANNNVEPFEGSLYMNSELWGNYEDYNVNDVIEYVDNNFRTLTSVLDDNKRNGRAIIGQSMGGYGGFRLALMHKEKYCAFAAHASHINHNVSLDNITANMLLENSGPPYSYAYATGGSFTQMMFLLGGAVAPYPDNPQTYIDPDIVEYAFDDNCNLIDTIWQKIEAEDVLPMLHNTTPGDSVGILFGCGTNDDWGFYDANLALTDTLAQMGLPYEFFSHDGGHSMPQEFLERAIRFLDSLLLSPTPAVNIPLTETGHEIAGLEIFPNPVKTYASISYTLLHSAGVKMSVINYLGQEVKACFNEFKPAGNHQYKIDITDLPGGIYFLCLEAEVDMLTSKFIKY